MGSRVVILGNGEWKDPREFFSGLGPGDLLIACDGAYAKARRLGVKPHILVGDLDSFPRTERIASETEVHRFPRVKNETDGELALRFALKKNPGEIVWYAALGDRWDQSLANCFLLAQAARKKIPVLLVQGVWDIYLVLNSVSIPGKRGDRVSLLPFSGRVTGIVSEGLKYSLRGDTLSRERSRGISNEMTSLKCRIEIGKGWLLLVHEARRK